MIEAIRRGEVRAVARAATLIENRRAGAWLNQLRALPVSALVIGVTGPPGVGKSTLVDRMARAFRSAGQTVGILAVDPTSPMTGGAILGDRIRMQEHHGDSGVFIRSMATRGSLGGLARATEDMVALLSASGRDVVIIETVGVGQSEVAIAAVAAVTVVVLAPGMGDDVQALKAGILEIASVFAINKADHDGAGRLKQDLLAFSDVPVLETVANEGKGIAELIAAIREVKLRPHASARIGGFVIDHAGHGEATDPGAHPSARAAGFATDHFGHGEAADPGAHPSARAVGLAIDHAGPGEAADAGAHPSARAVGFATDHAGPGEATDPGAHPSARGGGFAIDHAGPGEATDAGAHPSPRAVGFAIDHLGIAVRSIDTALAFYCDRLGMAEPHRESVTAEHVKVAMFAAGGSRIELLEAATEDSTIAKFIEKRGEGLHHVALRVRDFEATIERLRNGGARLLNEPRAGAGGHIYVFVHPASTGGVLLEIIKDEDHDS